MTKSMWMVRSEGGELIGKFLQGWVAVGWEDVGDLTEIADRDQMWARYDTMYPDHRSGKAANGVGVLFKFRAAVAVGDSVVTYDPEKRTYHIGEITSDYKFSARHVGKLWPHVRSVRWFATVARDALSPRTRNTLGSTLTLFSVNEDAASELLDVSSGKPRSLPDPAAVAKAEQDLVKEDEVVKAREMVKDSIVLLDDQACEKLVAALLRAMGFKARVTRRPDRNVDVVASPDGLGLKEPRIKAEVKHRSNSAIGAPDIRSFVAALRTGDRGLYVSTGGFTKEAHYEAERANNPVSLIDLDHLAELVIEHYESFDTEGRVILPLVRVYYPER